MGAPVVGPAGEGGGRGGDVGGDGAEVGREEGEVRGAAALALPLLPRPVDAVDEEVRQGCRAVVHLAKFRRVFISLLVLRAFRID